MGCGRVREGLTLELGVDGGHGGHEGRHGLFMKPTPTTGHRRSAPTALDYGASAPPPPQPGQASCAGGRGVGGMGRTDPSPAWLLTALLPPSGPREGTHRERGDEHGGRQDAHVACDGAGGGSRLLQRRGRRKRQGRTRAGGGNRQAWQISTRSRKARPDPTLAILMKGSDMGGQRRAPGMRCGPPLGTPGQRSR